MGVNDADGAYAQARMLLRRGDYEGAASLLAAVQPKRLRSTPPFAYYMLLGELHENLADPVRAAAAFERAVASSLEPERFSAASFKLARSLLHARDPARAEKAARKALQRVPGHWPLYDVMGVAICAQRGLEEAVETYRQADAALRVGAPDKQQRARDVMAATLAWLRHGAPPKGPRTDVARVTSDHGGWSDVALPLPRHDGGIERRDALSVEEFLRNYVQRNRPVILSGLMRDWPAWQAWRKDALLASLGARQVTVRNTSDVIADIYQGGRTNVRMPLTDYVALASNAAAHRDPPYLFKTEQLPELHQHFIEPPHFAGETFAAGPAARRTATIFYLGGPYSGVIFHQHTPAWNGLVYGEKQWLMLPPFHYFGPLTMAVSDWIDADLPRFADRVLTAVQYPGDIVYVPQYWYHAVMNRTECIGVAVELGNIAGLFDRMLTG